MTLFGRKPRVSLGIIGTAGRGSDRPRLSMNTFSRMVHKAEEVANQVNAVMLVSGGAAWADHVAVYLALHGPFAPRVLTLHLPGPIENGELGGLGGATFTGSDGPTATHYHQAFRRNTGIDGLKDIYTVQQNGAICTVSRGFLARNARVANDSSVLLAFTFGKGPPWQPQTFSRGTTAQAAGLKDGGTARTWNASKASVKIHIPLE